MFSKKKNAMGGKIVFDDPDEAWCPQPKMTMTFELPDGPLQIQLAPSEAKKLRDTLDGFIKVAEESGFPVPIRDW